MITIPKINNVIKAKSEPKFRFGFFILSRFQT
jgi:hypothetical protein